MKLKGKISVSRQAGHGESWEYTSISVDFPKDWYEPNTGGRFFTKEAKRKIDSGQVKVIVLVEE